VNFINFVERIRFTRMELIEIFKKTEGLKPAESLKKFDPVQIPVLELDAKADLEFINPTPIKRDVVMIL
jgi:hypothetical protein